jgi:hypothetical protein
MREKRPRSLENDLIDAVEAVTRDWTRVRKAEERQPGMVRFRAAKMIRESRLSQKDAAW